MPRKMIITSLFAILFISQTVAQSETEVPFSKGVNLTNWFQTSSAGEIDFSKYTYEDLVDVKSLGVDVIRLPINLHSMTQGGPDYQLDPLFLFFLDQVVDWAEELEIYLILDNHTFDPSEATDPNIGRILSPVWRNMATHFKDRSEYVLYEVLNEPHGISNAAWSDIQSDVIDIIRSVDSTHTIIVGASDFNSYRSLQFLPEYEDDNLIYTFHFYDPFVVTHQGATWTTPSLANLRDIPFPYDAANMPSLPSEFSGTWIQGAYSNYANEGNAAWIQDALDIAINFSESRAVPVFNGEFGVYIPNSDNQTRVNWYEVVASYLTEHNVSWTIWDYRGGFGVYEEGGNDLFDHDLNVPLLESLGFNIPEQTVYIIQPDSTGFDIYSDFTAQGVRGSNNINNGKLELYNTLYTYDGDYSIRWQGSSQYEHIGFDFAPNKDLTRLVDEGYELVFYVRGENPFSFDIRFIDTVTDVPEDKPWRMNVRIEESDLAWDGTWEEIRIPLSDFTEMGSWYNNQWFEPEGMYDWSALDVFQLVEESGTMGRSEIWIDAIGIVEAGGVTVSNEMDVIPSEYVLNQNFPNPFNPSTTISYSIPESGFVNLQVFNTLGQRVATLVNDQKVAGSHSVNFDASNLSSGVYFYSLETAGFIQTKKMMLIK